MGYRWTGLGLALQLAAGLGAEDPLILKARQILRETPLVDGHNDLAEQLRDRFKNRLATVDLGADSGKLDPPMQTDLPRLRRGGVGGVFFSAYVPASVHGGAAVSYLFEQMDVIHRVVGRHPGALVLARTAGEVEAAHRSGQVAALIGIEGGHALGNSLAVLRQASLGGARYLTLTHVKHNDWADAALWPGVEDEPPRHHGLSPFGQEVVRELNRLGMLVDLSHTSVETMRAALRVTAAPVIFSHSGARAVCDHPRNVPDEVLRSLARNGGIVMVDFVPGFLTEAYREWDNRLAIPEWSRLEKLHPKDPVKVIQALNAWKKLHPPPQTSLRDVADHIDHVRKVAGIDAVGIGTDFEGSDDFPRGLEDTSCFPALLAELLRRGYTAEEVAKVAGKNLLRVLRQAEAVARRLQGERPPSEATLEGKNAPVREK
ncbi:MAG: dipeptidase [Acidobacteria bacterium]|nr:dipeptidase [Acidobacteriota bacterium]